METKSPSLLRPLLAIFFLGSTVSLRADAVSEFASFTIFGKPDLAQLAQGDAKAVRGEQMSTPRFLSVQSCWVASGSPAQNADKLRRWNPAGHQELKVYLHVGGNNFSRLAQSPSISTVQALAVSTMAKAPTLQISKEEAAKIPVGSSSAFAGPVATFWTNVLQSRAAAGPFSQPPYDHTGQAIKPGDEINGLLRQQGKIQKQFSGLIGGKGDQYWEMLEVDNKAVLTLGTSYNRSNAGGFQAADVLYYASGGYYAAVTLYQMWPVDVGGKPSTLFWRGDMISSAELTSLAGVERLGAESAMMKDVSRSIRAFRADTGGR